MKTHHIEGVLEYSDDGLKIGYDLLSELFDNFVPKNNPSKLEDDYKTNRSSFTPNVFLRVYSCDKKCSLDEAKSGFIKKISGDLDILTHWYGYSEYTIEGYDTVNFTLGGHDLEKEFSSLIGKYVHFLLDINKPLEKESK